MLNNLADRFEEAVNHETYIGKPDNLDLLLEGRKLVRFKQHVMYAWGEGVRHGFGDFWDDIRDLLTDDEQRQAIEETR